MNKISNFNFLNTQIHHNIYITNIMEDISKKCDESYLTEYANEIKKWNTHDWNTLIGFKNQESWDRFCTALVQLANFYNVMYKKDTTEIFHLFFKSYNNNQLIELKNDCSKRFFKSIIDDVTTLSDQGYVFMYLTTQRECHDKNQFLMYMMDNFFYDRGVVGHVTWDLCTDSDEIEIIALNEKW